MLALQPAPGTPPQGSADGIIAHDKKVNSAMSRDAGVGWRPADDVGS